MLTQNLKKETSGSSAEGNKFSRTRQCRKKEYTAYYQTLARGEVNESLVFYFYSILFLLCHLVVPWCFWYFRFDVYVVFWRRFGIVFWEVLGACMGECLVASSVSLVRSYTLIYSVCFRIGYIFGWSYKMRFVISQFGHIAYYYKIMIENNLFIIYFSCASHNAFLLI